MMTASRPGQPRLLLFMPHSARPTLAVVPLADLFFGHAEKMTSLHRANPPSGSLSNRDA